MPDTFTMSPETSSAPASPRALSLSFTGTGEEYFRIWIVNLLLTIVTLGIYSAWAKVRRVQYFDRNTELDGAAFDFHGNPVAILKGRMVALVLVAGYQYAFGFSLTLGLLVFAALLAVLPYLLRGAMRFRLHNTTYRGLPFAFTGSVGGAYATFVPPMLVFMIPGAMGAYLQQAGPAGLTPWFGLLGLLYFAWPVLHAYIKRYQHANVQFGGADSQYTLKARRFWPPYLLAFLAMPMIGIVSAIAIPAMAAGSGMHRGGPPVIMMVVMLVLVYACILSTFPFIQSRIGNLVWSHTSFPGVTMVSDMGFRSLFKLQFVNVVLTILTLGLFHPFAAVRSHRYFLEHLHLTADADLDELVNDSGNNSVSAMGDGAADFIGIDFAL